ncbi:hypothetical protein ACFL1H_01110 [Nanoarchaeota archaeon]
MKYIQTNEFPGRLHPYDGTLLICDGIDGSGKFTVTKAIVDLLLKQNKLIFDTRTNKFLNPKDPYTTKNGLISPSLLNTDDKFIKYNDSAFLLNVMLGDCKKAIADADVIVTSEPRFQGIGREIRERIISKNQITPTPYSGKEIAWSYTLDRAVLYRDIIIPALKDGKIIIQERGFMSTMVYQPTYDLLKDKISKITIEDVLNMDGNIFALLNMPDLFLYPKITGETGAKRLGLREKQDDAIFEKEKILIELAKEYSSENFKKFFTERGTKFEEIDASLTIEDTIYKSLKIWKNYKK